MKKTWRLVPVWMAVFVLGGSLALVAQRGGGGGGGQRQGGFGGRGGAPAVPNTSMHRVAGVRDGVSIFPKTNYVQTRPLKAGEVDFKHYHTLEETLALLKMWAQKYPDLVDLYSVGKSFEGRDIWQITITNKKTGQGHRQAGVLPRGRAPRRRNQRASRPSSTSSTTSSRTTAPTRRSRRWSTRRRSTCKPNNNPDGNTLYHLTAQSAAQHRAAVRRRRRRPARRGPAARTSTATASSGRCASSSGPGKGNATKDPRDPKGRAMRRVRAGPGRLRAVLRGHRQRPRRPLSTRTASAASTCTATTRRTGGR